MKIETLSVDFTDEQKRYLEGFASGLQISKVGRGLGGAAAGKANAEPSGPDAAHIKAQDKVIALGKKLVDQEKFKREQHPFDAYPRLKQQALDNAPPSPADNFRWRYFGLFYVAPAQDSYMCRLRIPNGILKHWQFAGIADLAERYCGPFCHVTTRANLQVREVPPKNAVALIEGIQDLGLCSRGSGADNIRNVTGTPTAGIDPQELLDTRPYAREWHYHILNDRSLTGLPRKFNVAFDGAGKIAVLEDTNDIAFSAVEVRDGFDVEPGIWFALGIGGITGHRDFAKSTGIIVEPANAAKVADAIVRVFIDLGDRTNRLKARLKYVIDGIGLEKFMVLVEEKLGHALIQAGLLNGKSIGFLPLKVHFADEKESKKHGWPPEILVIDEWLLLDYAVCFLPAKPSCHPARPRFPARLLGDAGGFPPATPNTPGLRNCRGRPR